MKARLVFGAVLVMIALLVAIPWLASAKHAELQDGKDTTGLLDISRVRLHGQERPVWKIITFARWGTERIFDRGYAIVNIDARGDGHFEYYALLRSVGGRMTGELFRNRKQKSDFSVGNVKVWRNDRKSVSVRIPLRKLRMDAERTYYRWFVQTLMTGRNCPRVCIDRAPDEGSIHQSLVEPTPTPTITVSPSPTVTVEPSPSVSSSPNPSPTPSTSPSPSASPTP